MIPQPKDLARVDHGRRGARKRWGEPRILRLDTLTPTQRRLVMALLDLDAAPAPPDRAA